MTETPKLTEWQVHYAASQNVIDHVITALRESASTVVTVDGMADVAMVYDRALGLLLRMERTQPGKAAMLCAAWLINLEKHS